MISMNDELRKPEQRSNPDETGDRLWEISITALVFTALIAVTSRSIADADLWGHLRFGLDNIQAGSIAQVDPFSYLTAGQRWINHEWLSEVVFGLVWLAGESIGLVMLKTTVGILTLGVIYIYLRRSGMPVIRASVLLILGWLGILTAIATVRPHMFTLLFTALTFIIIAKAEQGRYRWLWAAPLVMLLWINFHGGVLAGLGFLCIWTFIHIIIHPKEWIRILPPVIVSIFALLVNPYGLDLVTFLFRTATVARPEIVEWQPIKVVSLLGGIYFILLAITIFGLVYSQRKKDIPIIVLLVVAALLPFVAFRHLPLFALAVLVFGGPYIANAWEKFSPTPQLHRHRPRWLSIATLVIALILMVWSIPNFPNIVIPNQPVPFFPDRAVALLAESQVSGNLGVEFNWGQYVIWHLGPEIQVSMDGRRETVYPDDKYEIYISFIKGSGQWDVLLEDYETHMVLISKFGPAYNLMKIKPGWEIIFEDSVSALFAVQGWDQIDTLNLAAQNLDPDFTNSQFP